MSTASAFFARLCSDSPPLFTVELSCKVCGQIEQLYNESFELTLVHSVHKKNTLALFRILRHLDALLHKLGRIGAYQSFFCNVFHHSEKFLAGHVSFHKIARSTACNAIRRNVILFIVKTIYSSVIA